KSFPKKYFWSQCHFDGAEQPQSIVVSAAIIPYLGFKFTGTFCVAVFNGKEIRLATYLGAKVLEFNENRLVVKQGKLKLEVNRLGEFENSQTLMAPNSGGMTRQIKESVEQQMQYKLTKGNTTLFDATSKNAAFEYSGSVLG
ncbi:MAG: hypothetical protein FWD32_01875, partial [Firmicutes bacterium]|nr:hypothetical protein [Bacillota bacterium]